MRRLDHPNPSSALLIQNLITKGFHSSPMNLRAEMMLRMVPVVEPSPVIKPVIRAHTPGERFVWITSIVPVIAIQIGKAVTEIVERKKKTNITPVQDREDDECADKKRQLQNTPECFARVLAL